MIKLGYKDAVYVGERTQQKHTGYGNTVLYMDILYLMIVTEWRLGFECPDNGASNTGSLQAAVDKFRLKTVHRQKNDKPTFGLTLDGLVTYLGYSCCSR
jgi:hypothetical protein